MYIMKKIAPVAIALMLLVINTVVMTVSATSEANVTAYHKFDLDHDGVVDIFDLGLLKRECIDNPNDPRIKELSDFILCSKDDTPETKELPQLASPPAGWFLEEETYSEDLTRMLSQYLQNATSRKITCNDDIATISFSLPEFDGVISAKIGVPNESKSLINLYTEAGSYALVSDFEHYYVMLIGPTNNTDSSQISTAIALWDLTDELYSNDTKISLIDYLTNATITNVTISDDIATISFAEGNFEGIIKANLCVPDYVYNLTNIYTKPGEFALETDGVNYYIELC